MSFDKPSAQRPDPYAQPGQQPEPFGQHPSSRPDPFGPQTGQSDPFGEPQQPSYGQPTYGQQPEQPTYGEQPGYGQPKGPTEPLAIWGFVCSFLFWPAGLILSIIASKRIKASGAEGKGLSLAGLIISIVAALGTVFFGVVLAIASTAAVTSVDALAEAMDDLPSSVESSADDNAAGSRNNPIAYGEVMQFDNEDGTAVEWEVSLGAPTWDGTAIVAADDYNDPAPAGEVYVILPVSTRNLSTEGKTPWLETEVKFVSADGRSFSSTMVSMEGSAMDVEDIYEGGESTGNIAILIPTDALTGGTWSVTHGFSNPEIFVAAL